MGGKESTLKVSIGNDIFRNKRGAIVLIIVGTA